MGYRLGTSSALFCLLCTFLLLPALSFAAEFRLISDTILRAFESNTSGGDDLTLPIYEYVQADVGERGEQPLTFHLYGWGRVDLTDSDYYDAFYDSGKAAGELLYGYAEYRHPASGVMARLGRQYVFSGVTNESIDGLRFDTGLTPLFTLSAYGGWPVALDATDGRSGDSIYGGRIAHRPSDLYEIGVSYMNKENDNDRAEELLGLDFGIFLPAVSLTGLSVRDLEGDGWAEHLYEANFSFGPVRLRPFFERFRYEDYFATGAQTGGPFLFLPETDEILTVFGADAMWDRAGWEMGLKGKYYDYRERGDSSVFLSAVATRQLEGLSHVGGELGRMEGDGAENDYLLARAFVYWDQVPADRLLHFLTGDVIYAYYDQQIYGENHALFVSVGGGRRFLDNRLELHATADYSFDPYFDSDLRGWLMARYSFDVQ